MSEDPESTAVPIATPTLLVERSRYEALLAAERELGERRDGAIPPEIVQGLAAGIHPVRVWRVYRNLKQTELAARAGLAQSTIAEIERGKNGRGSKATLATIARVLDAPLWSVEFELPENLIPARR